MQNAGSFDHEMAEETWRKILLESGEVKAWKWQRLVFGLIPRSPRCRLCYAPFRGIGGALVRSMTGRQPSKLNAMVCNDCELFARKHPGGAEVELTILFADVRGSTGLAERESILNFRMLIDRFFRVATDVLMRGDAMIEKLIGDGVTALFVPGFAGRHYSRRSFDSARELLEKTGHGPDREPWIPIGIGIHHGTAFVGAVGSSEGLIEITALGDTVNIAARLASEAGPGEILASEEACRIAGIPTEGFPQRLLQLKGRTEPVAVRVIT